MKTKKLEQGQEVTINVPFVYEVGQEVTINVPFVYEVGQEGPVTGNELNTIEDMEDEVRAELDEVNVHNLHLEVEKESEENSKTFNLLELASELADRKLRETFDGDIDIEDGDGVRYTEDAQDYFNELYDEFYQFLERI